MPIFAFIALTAFAVALARGYPVTPPPSSSLASTTSTSASSSSRRSIQPSLQSWRKDWHGQTGQGGGAMVDKVSERDGRDKVRYGKEVEVVPMVDVGR